MPFGTDLKSDTSDDSRRSSDDCKKSRESQIRDIDQQPTPVPGVTPVVHSPAIGNSAESMPDSHDELPATRVGESDESSNSEEQWDGFLSDPGEDVPPPVSLTDWTGRAVGAEDRYEILSLLGKGGMGKVYLATARNLDDAHVALKVPYESFLEMPGMRERFEREFKALILLQHPHICRVLDTGRFRNVPFVVLQNLSGGNLRDRYLSIATGSPARSIETLLKWLREVSRALDFMHAKGYLHRDVKPENILFDEQGNAYLGDFGIVRALDDAPQSDSTLTRPGECIGTLGYVAPELLKGKKDLANGRSDLYSLAAVVYLYLTDKPPFDGDTNDMIRVAQLTESPLPAHEANPAIPEAASLVLERALAREPEDRQATCEAFTDELAAAYGLVGSDSGLGGRVAGATLSDQPSVSRPTPDGITTDSKRRSTSMTVGLVAVALLLLAFVSFPDLVVDADPSPPPNPDSIISETGLALENARGYVDAGEFQAAVDEINRLPVEHLKAEHYSVRARGFFGAGDTDTALSEMERAIETAPDDAIYYSERSQMLLAEGVFQSAVEDLTRAIDRNDTEPRYYAQRAIAHLQLKDYQSAVADYGEAIQRVDDAMPKSEQAAWHNGRAAARVLQSSDEQSLRLALVDANAAVEAQPEEPRHYRNRAQLHERLGDKASQLKDLDDADRLERDN